MSELLDRRLILDQVDAASKEDVLRKMTKVLETAGMVDNADTFLKDVKAREALEPTSVGFDLGLPHGKTAHAMKTGVAFARLSRPVTWNPETGDVAKMVIMLAVPENHANETHLELLAKLSRKLVHEDFRDALYRAEPEKVYDLLSGALGDDE